LGNGILVILFLDVGKWLFVLTLKSHLNNVLRVMFTLRDRRIMRENCYCPRPKDKQSTRKNINKQAVNKPKHLEAVNKEKYLQCTHKQSTSKNIVLHTSSQQAKTFTHKQSTSQNIYTQAINKPKHLHTSSQQAKTFTHK